MTSGDAEERARLIALVEERQDEAAFEEAKRFLDAARAAGENADLLRDYGYIHECRGAALVREAVRWYERSLELDPSAANPAHAQLIGAHARLLQTSDAIDRYKKRVEAAPEDVAGYRHLADAFLVGGGYEEAGKVVDAGLALLPDDPALLEARGRVLEGRGLFDEALETWQAVFERDPDRSISPRYSRVFLLQRLGRLAEAAAEWEAIIAWLLARGYTIQAEWPKRELARLRELIAEDAT